jgi:deoxyribodipyrimidine photolyase
VNEILIQNNDKTESIFFWFRRDLRLEDNIGLFHALESDIQSFHYLFMMMPF